MHLLSLPRHFKGERSPVLASDSPFPMLKPELRYKGVYERAGFDVRKPGADDTASIPLKNSPVSPSFALTRHNHKAQGQHPQNTTKSRGVSAPTSGYREHALPYLTSSSAYSKGRAALNPSLQKHSQHPTPHPPHSASGPTFPIKSRPFAGSGQNPPSASSGSFPHLGQPLSSAPAQDTYSPIKARPHNPYELPRMAPGLFKPTTTGHHTFDDQDVPDRRPYNQDIELYNQSQMADSDTSKNMSFIIPDKYARLDDIDNSDRNKKNLRIVVNEGLEQQQYSNNNLYNTTPFDSSAASVSMATTTTSSMDYRSRGDSYTSVQSTQTAELTKAPYPLHTKERALDESLADLQEDLTLHRNQQPVGTFKPATTGLAQTFRNQAPEHANNPYGHTTPFNPIVQHSNQDPNSSSDSYENYLSAKEHQKRTSQLSTVSSILSKHGNSLYRSQNQYDSDYENENGDDEVERELQRQLDALKTGSEISLDSKRNQSSTDSIGTPASTPDSLPVFKITDNHSMRSGLERFSAELMPEKPPMQQVFVKPEPNTPSSVYATFRDDSVDSPETIKPLSPKNHFLRRDIPSTTYEEENSWGSTEDSEQEILLKNPTPSGFEAFPRSVITPDFPSFRTSGVQKHAAGTGPCRTCGSEIEPESIGSQKAIFSKKGDLSGQWHRGCFLCLYSDCSIRFSKHVTPYVLLDNPFCSYHYHKLNDTLCQTCHCGIEGECIENELKQKWHLQCLKCTHCQEQIDKDYYLVEDMIMCVTDATRIIADMKLLGMLTQNKVEKRRTRMMFIE